MIFLQINSWINSRDFDIKFVMIPPLLSNFGHSWLAAR